MNDPISDEDEDLDPDEGAATGNGARKSSVHALIGAAVLSYMLYVSQ